MYIYLVSDCFLVEQVNEFHYRFYVAVIRIELYILNKYKWGKYFSKAASILSFKHKPQPLSSLFLSGEGAFIPEDPSVAAGVCRAQQTARSCHVPGPADEWCSGHHGSWCSPSRHAHL